MKICAYHKHAVETYPYWLGRILAAGYPARIPAANGNAEITNGQILIRHLRLFPNGSIGESLLNFRVVYITYK